jgi:hypothetical protein
MGDAVLPSVRKTSAVQGKKCDRLQIESDELQWLLAGASAAPRTGCGQCEASYKILKLLIYFSYCGFAARGIGGGAE